ncbi:aflatoxin B1-aldehyde reductase [Auriscalpium vulgare]|uniref:Aflatoxin B1-aldehyde reductase n=1 Tax=Auriscalpium vulgare TaxID=40419 RepID=A0ACB8RLV2_9AGAM|nr:aflatoxin B1-aldehyde reductase [Auriscalpium vulgare]
MSTAPGVHALFGAATIGTEGSPLTTVTTVEGAQPFVDTLLRHGHSGIDTARLYSNNTSEQLVAKLKLDGVRVDTKIHPNQPGGFAPAKLKEQVQLSLNALNGVKIRTLYLHAPDRSTPFEETLSAIDELHKQGAFERFGLSNFTSWEVAEIATIARLKGYVAPTAYEGIYNCLDRVNEIELFPCLRKYDIRFAAYSPLAGGFLTGFYLDDEQDLASNMRFNPKSPIGPFYMGRYGRSAPVLRELKALGDKHGVGLSEMAIRWIVHHSQLRESDVGVIYGGNTLEHFETALENHVKGPLPEEIVQALEEAWVKVKAHVPIYAH